MVASVKNMVYCYARGKKSVKSVNLLSININNYSNKININ